MGRHCGKDAYKHCLDLRESYRMCRYYEPCICPNHLVKASARSPSWTRPRWSSQCLVVKRNRLFIPSLAITVAYLMLEVYKLLKEYDTAPLQLLRF